MNKQFLGQLHKNISLERYTTWRVGGPAKQLYQPKNSDDLVNFLVSLDPNEPIYWIGLGSNLLIRDGGFQGTIISTLHGLNDIQAIDGTTIRIEAGASSAQAARYFARSNLTGGEFLAGIPGTIGGALALNAGCFNGETWQLIEKVETITRQGVIQTRKPTDFQIGYRNVSGPEGEYFLAGYFHLKKGEKEKSLEAIRQLLAHRAATQPTGEHCCGSVFRNPPNDYAGRLIEACGLKGYRIGGAYVSEKHANFIINDGSATATEIESLIEHVAAQVKQLHNIELIKEVKVIGEKR